MKRIFPGRKDFFNVMPLSLGLIILSSCSTLSGLTERTVMESDAKEQASRGVVPKAEYDALLKKYEALINEKQIANAKTAKDTPDLARPAILDKLANAPETKLEETVDVFSKEQLKQLDAPEQIGVSTIEPAVEVDLNADEIEKEIGLIRSAQMSIDQNKFNQAMENLKFTENSKVPQIRVHSRFLVGEILFIQKEYDLAMQIFEEIISKQAFSGVVIKSLGRLIVCAEKLQLADKKQKYHSLLHDFFES